MKLVLFELHFQKKLDSFDNCAYAVEAMPLHTKSQLSRGKVNEFEIRDIGQKDIILAGETPLKKKAGVERQSNKSGKNGPIIYFIWAGNNVILVLALW